MRLATSRWASVFCIATTLSPAWAGPFAEGQPFPDLSFPSIDDDGKYVSVASTLVPRRVRSGRTTRVHLELRPNVAADAHWNNEVGGLVVWLEPPEGWRVGRRLLSAPRPPAPVSDEARQLEVELRAPEDADGPIQLPGYALYYVCEGRRGACLYRRQDLRIAVDVADGAGDG